MAQKKHKRQRCSATGVSMRDKLAYQRELKAAIDRQAHDATLRKVKGDAGDWSER